MERLRKHWFQRGNKMAIVLDHTIVAAKDQAATVAFYVKILGFKDEGMFWDFAVVRVNESLTLDFIASKEFSSRHFAFAMDKNEFETVFGRIREAKIPYGDGPHDIENMKGPGETQGARGMGKAVYFCDPNGHVLEIKTY